MFLTPEVSSGQSTLLHGQVDQTPAGKPEDLGEKSSVWALGIPYWYFLKHIAVSKNRLYGKGCLDDEQGKCQSANITHVYLTCTLHTLNLIS